MRSWRHHMNQRRGHDKNPPAKSLVTLCDTLCLLCATLWYSFKNSFTRMYYAFTNLHPGKSILLFLLLFGMIISCKKDDNFGEVNTNPSEYSGSKGVFIVNEGNFGQANGSISFLDTDSLKMGNDIFSHANGRPVGDVPISMAIIEDYVWIVVNNSARIEICKVEDMISVGSISDLTSPRFLLPLPGNKAYVSDFYSSEITIINTSTHSISGAIDIGHSSEKMILAAGKVFVTFWSNYNFPGLENNQIVVIDPMSDEVVNNIQVGKEPNSMVIDKNGGLWILCSGGYAGEEKPSLWRIDPTNLQIEGSIYFNDVNQSPDNLCINGTRDTLCFLNRGIFSMAVEADPLPTTALIPEEGSLFYSLAIDPGTSIIYATDAIDYQQRGLVLRYRPDGMLIDSFRGGVIPGMFEFR